MSLHSPKKEARPTRKHDDPVEKHRVIWKYPVALNPLRQVFEIAMPEGAEVLTVQLQGRTPMLWARVNPDAPTDIRQFAVLGTGHEHPARDLKYVGTWQEPPYVWHLFEVLR